VHDEIDYSDFGEDILFVKFLKRMLTRDQDKRATIIDLLDDPYLNKVREEPVELFNVDFIVDDVSSESCSLSTDSERKMSVVQSVDEISNQSNPELPKTNNVVTPYMRLFQSAPSNTQPQVFQKNYHQGFEENRVKFSKKKQPTAPALLAPHTGKLYTMAI